MTANNNIIEVPKQSESLDPMDGVALNQKLSDREIINKILSHRGVDNAWGSAIKIGDTWLSIPCRVIAIPSDVPSENNKKPIIWKSYDQWAALKSGKRKPGAAVLEKFGFSGRDGMSVDPLEKFGGFATNAQNSVREAESIGRLTSLTVENFRPSDKIMTLQFKCSQMSIQNNIRPIMAQFLLSPFLPVINSDLAKIVNPHDSNPDYYIDLGLARHSGSGRIIFKPRDLDPITGEHDEVEKSEALAALGKEIMKAEKLQVLNTMIPSEIEHYYRERAYWMAPVYVQLVDFSISSVRDKRASFDVNLVVRVVSPGPAYGGIAMYMRNEEAIKTQMSLQDTLRNMAHGDNELVRKISGMFGIATGSHVDKPLVSDAIKNPENYSLLDSPSYDGEYSDTISHAIYAMMRNPAGIISGPGVVMRTGAHTPMWLNEEGPYVLTAPGSAFNSLVLVSGGPSIHENPNATINVNHTMNKQNSTHIPCISDNKQQIEWKKSTDVIEIQTKFKVMQYNLRRLLSGPELVATGSDTPDGSFADYDTRLANISKIILKENPDILCVQELGPGGKAAADITKKLNEKEKERNSGREYSYVYDSSNQHPGDHGIGIAIISHLTVVDQKILRLESSPKLLNELMHDLDVEYPNTYDRSEISSELKGRPILKITFERNDGSQMIVFCCHFKSRLDSIGNPDSGIIRRYESKSLVSEIKRMEADEIEKDIPFIIVGDLNIGLDRELNDPGTPFPGLRSHRIIDNNGHNKYEFPAHKYEQDRTLDIIMCEASSILSQFDSKLKNFTLPPNIPRNAIVYPAIKGDSPGTFYFYPRSQWSILDHILYSHHHFLNQAQKITGKILDTYREQQAAYKSSVVRPWSTIDPGQFSDHYPVVSEFVWDTTVENNNAPTTDRSFTIVGKDDAAYSRIEMFQYPQLNYNGFNKLCWDKTILRGSLAYESLDAAPPTTHLTINPEYQAVNFTNRTIPFIITGIFYSKLLYSYVFTALIDITENGVPINSAYLDRYNRNSAGHIIVPVMIIASNTKNGLIHNAIENVQDDGAIDALVDIFKYEFKKNNQKSAYGAINISKFKSMIYTPEKKIISTTIPGQYLDPDKYRRYFTYDSEYYNNLPDLDPTRDLTINISQCIPFRNYYLPLLTEFRGLVNNPDTEWIYTYNIDEFSPFKYSMNGSDTDDTRVYFSRKMPNTAAGSVFRKIREALTDLIVLNDGSESDKKRFIGNIAKQALDGGSARISKLMSTKVSEDERANFRRNLIEGGAGSSYQNVLAAEVVLIILTKLARIRYLIDPEYENEISAILRNKESIEIESEIWRGTPAATKEYIRKIIKYLAFVDISKEYIQDMSGERRLIREYLNIANGMRIKDASEGTSSDEMVNNGRKVDITPSGIPMNYASLTTIFSEAYKKMIDTLTDYSNPATELVVSFEIIE